MNVPDRLTCLEVFRRLDDYVDRELAPEEVAKVRAHLETCAACASEYLFESSLLHAVREKLRRIATPPDLMAKISRRIAEAAGDRRD